MIETKLTLMTKDQLVTLASEKSIDENIRYEACEKAGHQRKVGCKRCVCERCGKKLEHDFNEKNICRYCSGKKIVEHKLLGTEDKWGRRVPADGREDTCYTLYPDGEKVLEWSRHTHLVAQR